MSVERPFELVAVNMLTDKKVKVKQELIKATEAVRQKYKDLFNDRIETKRLLEKHYKPITKKLGTLIELNKNNSKEDVPTATAPATAGVANHIAIPLLSPSHHRHTPKRARGRPRGPGRPAKHKQYSLPTTPIIMKKSKVVLERLNNNNNKLDELLTHPSNSLKEVKFLSPSTLTRMNSNHTENTKRKQFDSPSPYHPTIKPGRRVLRSHSAREQMFDHSRMDADDDSWVDHYSSDTAHGSGLYKKAMEINRTEFVHWDNVNELVSRLKLLIASQTAGHSGHHNEIISIVEELREADIIQ